MMLAAQFTGPRTLQIGPVPEPPLPEDGLLLRVEACGVCGSDVRRWREGPAVGAEPIIPGHEVGGVVVAIGCKCQGWRVGDRLALAPDVHCGVCYYCQHGRYNLCDDLRLVGITPEYPGGFAQVMALPGKVLRDGIVHPIPEGLDYVGAALAEPLSSVLAAHDKVATSLGDTVVVIGAGPIGCLLVAIAKAHGARVIVSQRSATRRDLVARFGPDEVIDPLQDDLGARVRQATGGLGADIAICANPVADTQRQAVELVRKGGTVVLFGGLPKADPLTHLDGNHIHYGEIAVVGAFSYHPTHHAQALDLLARGVIRVEDVVTHRYPLAQAAEALEVAASGAGLKVVLEPHLCR